MKYKLAVLLAALVCTGAMIPKTAEALRINISIGDRPYYTHGAWYYNNGVRWYWISGHWAWRHHHRVWVPGHYAPR
ncbi:MAG: hypothetical protein QOG51_877 [Verrucomicrobiota bacterium]|jgi:hypothetical protein